MTRTHWSTVCARTYTTEKHTHKHTQLAKALAKELLLSTRSEVV